MSQDFTLTPETIREVQHEIDATGVPDAYLDFLELADKLITRGWGTTPAKSSEHGHVDQPMLQHIGNAVVVLVCLYEQTDAFDENKLRNMIALITAHDFHKLRPNPDPEGEFDITRDEVETFTDETGIADYAPDVSTAEFHAAICALHKKDDRSRVGVAPVSFDDYRPYLNFADTIASRADPGDFTEHSRTHELREALGPEYTINYHKIQTPRGLFTNIANKAIADGLKAEHDLDLFSIYHNGCTYLGDQRCPETPVTDDLLDEIYTSLVSTLRTAHSAFQDPEHMLSGFSISPQRHYPITDRDFVFASQEEVLRAVVYKCVNATNKSDDLPDTVCGRLNNLEAHIDTSLPRTRRLDGIARLVHTIHTEIAPYIGGDTEPLEITCAAFNTTADTRDTIADLIEDHPELGPTATYFPVKYLIAQDVLDQYYTGHTVRDIMQTLADDVLENLTRYDGWETLHIDRADDIYDELKAFLLYNTELDGNRLIRETGGRDEYDRYYDRLDTTYCCARCDHQTTASPSDGFRLLKEYPPDWEITHADGTTIKLGRAEHGYCYCYPCQLDLALRLSQEPDTTDGKDATENQRLYVHLIPDYFYAPFLWRIYRGVFESYLRVDTTNTLELADSILESDPANGYQSWLDSTLASDIGPEFAHEQRSAFTPEAGFGSHAIGHDRTHTVSETEELLVVLSAAAYAGVRAYVTDSPTARVRGDKFDSAIKLDESFDICDYTGSEISLSSLDSTLTTIAAMHRLTDALGKHDTDPLDGLNTITRFTTLPGAAFLEQLENEDPELAAEYITESRYLDTQLVNGTRDDDPTAWPFDISTSNDPAALWDATTALADTIWPLMHPQTVDMDTLCEPIDAALDATQATCNTTDESPRHLDLRAQLEDALMNCHHLNPSHTGEHVDTRITAFAERFVADLIDSVCDGDPTEVDSHARDIRRAFYAAILDRATTTFDLETEH